MSSLLFTVSARALLSTALVFLFISIPAVAAEKCNRPFSGALNYESLKGLIARCNVKSIDQLLPLLPDDFRSNFSLVYKSRSPEKDAVDPLHPRAILFSNDGKLIISFTGNPEKDHYDALQVIQFRDDSAKFEFNELEFRKTGSVVENGRALSIRRIEPHHPPESCATCHRADSRPNWDSYRFWPGIYGSNDDLITKSETPREAKEAADFEQFRKTTASTGRYGQIRWPQGHDADPYRNYYQEPDDGGTYKGLSRRPNLRLTMLIARLNAKRVLRLMQLSPQYEAQKYRLAAYLLSGKTIQDYNAGKPARRCLETPESTETQEAADKLMRRTVENKFARVGETPDFHGTDHGSDSSPNSFYDGTSVIRLLEVARILRFPSEMFSTAFEEDSFSVFEGQFSMDEIVGGEILRDLAKSNPYLARYLNYQRVSDPAADLVVTDRDRAYAQAIDSLGGGPTLSADEFSDLCKILKEKTSGLDGEASQCQGNTNEACAVMPPKITQAIGALGSRVESKASSSTPVSICASCHAGAGATARSIPFDNTELLRRMLKDDRPLRDKIVNRLNRTGNGKMPPNRTLTNSEKQEIVEYLDRLRNSEKTTRNN